MRILDCSIIDINCLKGSTLINEHGIAYTCLGIGFCLDTHEIMIDLKETESDGEHYDSIYFSLIKDWSIQFNSSFNV